MLQFSVKWDIILWLGRIFNIFLKKKFFVDFIFSLSGKFLIYLNGNMLLYGDEDVTKEFKLYLLIQQKLYLFVDKRIRAQWRMIR